MIKAESLSYFHIHNFSLNVLAVVVIIGSTDLRVSRRFIQPSWAYRGGDREVQLFYLQCYEL